ncbi:MAG: chemotaxis protein CheW [Candidatus Rokuibacteriota bacterium]
MPLERSVATARAAPPRAPATRSLVFTCGAVRYAVDGGAVRHSLPADEGADGNVTFSGTTYPVLDVRTLFGLPHVAPGRLVLVTEASGRRAALLVDAVIDLTVVDDASVHPLPPVFQGRERRWFRGVTRLGGETVVMLRLAGILEA